MYQNLAKCNTNAILMKYKSNNLYIDLYEFIQKYDDIITINNNKYETGKDPSMTKYKWCIPTYFA